MRSLPRIAGFLGANVIRVWGSTWRFRLVDIDHMEAARELAPATIYAFWHGRMLPLAYKYRGRMVHVLASEHRDGELMGQTIRFLGFGHIRGSSTRGGARAIREMVTRIGQGFDLGLTVDGPRGPKFVVKPGLVEVAKLTGSPVVPVATGSRVHFVLSSWDAFEIPVPFTVVSVRFGEPILVPYDASPQVIELKRREVERSLLSLTELNDDDVRR